METVQCSCCRKKVERIKFGIYEEHMPKMHQWLANVCVKCKRIYCSSCMKLGGPTPCPVCGEETKPALRMFLQEAGLL